MVTCRICSSPKIEAFGLCASCNHNRRKGQSKIIKDALKFAQVKRSIPTRKKIAKVSAKRVGQNKAYLKLRAEFMEKHPDCQGKLEGCEGNATECHHSGGRQGERLNDVTKFIALCSSCHFAVHNVLSAKEVRDRGFKA